jgi:prolyl 4-hydroxylase
MGGVILLLILICIISYLYYQPRNELDVMVGQDFGNLPVITYTYGKFRLLKIYNILTPEECDIIIKLGQASKLREDLVYHRGKKVYNAEKRGSKTAWFDDKDNPIISRLAKFTSAITNIPSSHQEPLQFSQYDAGGGFSPHYDTCSADRTICEEQEKGAGKRVATLLVYLNDDFTGGQTEFLNIGVTIQPRRGMGILFWNTDKHGKIYRESLHAGNKVLHGRKYICTKWSHLRAYPVYH